MKIPKFLKIGKKGGMDVWFHVLGIWFIALVAWIPLDQAITVELYNVVIGLGADVAQIDSIMRLWDLYPYAIVFGGILYGVIMSQRRDDPGLL